MILKSNAKKVVLLLIGLYSMVNLSIAQKIAVPNLSDKEIYPTIRNSTSPSNGASPKFNSPSFQWPSKKKATFSIRISTSRLFDQSLIEKNNLVYAIYNPHQQLSVGKWYWQYKNNQGNWNAVDSFIIKPTTRLFPTPKIATLLENIPSSHPRILITKAKLNELRIQSIRTKEAVAIISEANQYINKPLPKESDALPTFIGKDKFENEKIESLASKKCGWMIQEVLTCLSQAYILTGDEKYFNTARLWMLEVSTWNPLGPSHTNNFGDGGIMSGLAIGVDSFWDV